MVAGRILGGGSAQVELQQAARQTPVSSTERRRAAQAAHRGQGERGEREREGEHGQGGREGSRRFIEQEGRGEGEPWRETTAFKAINVDITTINGERNGEGRGETTERRARIGRLGVGRLGVAGGARPGRGTARRGVRAGAVVRLPGDGAGRKDTRRLRVGPAWRRWLGARPTG
jgi:hypothetical protein